MALVATIGIAGMFALVWRFMTGQLLGKLDRVIELMEEALRGRYVPTRASHWRVSSTFGCWMRSRTAMACIKARTASSGSRFA